MPLEDYTSYTEVDPNNRIALVGTDHIDLTTWRNEEAYLYKDKGVAHFTDFTHDLDFRAGVDANLSQSYAWGVANDLHSFVWDRAGEWVGVRLCKFYDGAGSIKRAIIEGKPDGAEDVSIELVKQTWYFLRIVKSGTTIYCGIYSTAILRDAGDGTDGDVDNISTTLSTDKSFRYIYACSACNSGNAWGPCNADIENLDLQELTQKSVSGSIVASGSLLRNKALTVSGSVAASGGFVRDKELILLGSIIASGGFGPGDKTLIIPGQATALGTLLIDKELTVSGLTELLGTIIKKRIFTVQGIVDALGAIVVNKPVAVQGLVTAAGALVRDKELVLSGLTELVGSVLADKTLTLEGLVTALGIVEVLKEQVYTAMGLVTATGTIIIREEVKPIGDWVPKKRRFRFSPETPRVKPFNLKRKVISKDIIGRPEKK